MIRIVIAIRYNDVFFKAHPDTRYTLLVPDGYEFFNIPEVKKVCPEFLEATEILLMYFLTQFRRGFRDNLLGGCTYLHARAG